MFGKNGVRVTGVSRITLPNPVATWHREALHPSGKIADWMQRLRERGREGDKA